MSEAEAMEMAQPEPWNAASAITSSSILSHTVKPVAAERIVPFHPAVGVLHAPIVQWRAVMVQNDVLIQLSVVPSVRTSS